MRRASRCSTLSESLGLRLSDPSRRARRSFATAAQIALAVATLLALLSVGAGVAQTTRGWFDDNHFDVWVQSVASEPLGADARRLIESTAGVRATQAWVHNDIRVGGRAAQAWGRAKVAVLRTDGRQDDPQARRG